ncbi:MAG: hypothetical protein HC837_10250 [Chloroflexaceae bacterium]|nr:hypothetical protein [Chloroflexaceae bacterium]
MNETAHEQSGMARLRELDLLHILIQVTSISATYALVLAWLERRWPRMKPDHIWAEVVGGVMISLMPVALEARQTARSVQQSHAPLNWQSYEQAVWLAFVAAATPIMLWQLSEATHRQTRISQSFAVAEQSNLADLLTEARQSLNTNPALAGLLMDAARNRLERENHSEA